MRVTFATIDLASLCFAVYKFPFVATIEFHINATLEKTTLDPRLPLPDVSQEEDFLARRGRWKAVAGVVVATLTAWPTPWEQFGELKKVVQAPRPGRD